MVSKGTAYRRHLSCRAQMTLANGWILPSFCFISKFEMYPNRNWREICLMANSIPGMNPGIFNIMLFWALHNVAFNAITAQNNHVLFMWSNLILYYLTFFPMEFQEKQKKNKICRKKQQQKIIGEISKRKSERELWTRPIKWWITYFEAQNFFSLIVNIWYGKLVLRRCLCLRFNLDLLELIR